MRTLFAKIFFWFWGAIAVVLLSMLVGSVLGGTEPLYRRWLTHSLGLYAKSSVDFYTHGGSPLLRQYLDDAEATSGIQATLIDPQGRDVLGRGLPPLSGPLLAAARRERKSQFRTGIVWAGASVVATPQGDFIFVARVHPLRGFWSGVSWGTILLRWGLALFAAGLLCWLIARHITAPIRALQAAARRISAGDLAVRATPAIPSRNDELADLARDFDRMADRIQSLMRKQQELLADISHELRSPLTRLSVSLELARRGEADAMDRMQTDLDRIDSLIQQVLTLTRLQLQQGRKIETPVNLRTVLESVAEDANFEGKSTGKSVVITRADECWVQGDANLLRSCAENVVRNAIRYTRAQTTVEIALTRGGSSLTTAVLVVADRGQGVPAEALPRLFEPFYRVSQARDPISGGAGLGLSIAQKVVSLHGGTISARNRDEGGLIVEIQLPVCVTPSHDLQVPSR